MCEGRGLSVLAAVWVSVSMDPVGCYVGVVGRAAGEGWGVIGVWCVCGCSNIRQLEARFTYSLLSDLGEMWGRATIVAL